jgi:hypothetical protein
MTRFKESTAAISKHVLPMSHIRRPNINAFLDSTPIPETQKTILANAPTHVWKIAASQTTPAGEHPTAFSPNKAVPHYPMQNAAMFILKHGVDKITEMPTKIKEARQRQEDRDAEVIDAQVIQPELDSKPLPYNPLSIFSDRRSN